MPRKSTSDIGITSNIPPQQGSKELKELDKKLKGAFSTLTPDQQAQLIETTQKRFEQWLRQKSIMEAWNKQNKSGRRRRCLSVPIPQAAICFQEQYPTDCSNAVQSYFEKGKGQLEPICETGSGSVCRCFTGDMNTATICTCSSTEEELISLKLGDDIDDEVFVEEVLSVTALAEK